jgi:hypothetical protein
LPEAQAAKTRVCEAAQTPELDEIADDFFAAVRRQEPSHERQP